MSKWLSFYGYGFLRLIIISKSRCHRFSNDSPLGSIWGRETKNQVQEIVWKTWENLTIVRSTSIGHLLLSTNLLRSLKIGSNLILKGWIRKMNSLHFLVIVRKLQKNTYQGLQFSVGSYLTMITIDFNCFRTLQLDNPLWNL